VYLLADLFLKKIRLEVKLKDVFFLKKEGLCLSHILKAKVCIWSGGIEEESVVKMVKINGICPRSKDSNMHRRGAVICEEMLMDQVLSFGLLLHMGWVY